MSVTIRLVDPLRYDVRTEHGHCSVQAAVERIHCDDAPEVLSDFRYIDSIIDHDTDYELEILSHLRVDP